MRSGRVLLTAAIALGVLGVEVGGASVKKVDLKLGYVAGSIVSRPVMDGSAIGPVEILTFREAYDKKGNVFRKKSTWAGLRNMTIDKSLDLGAVFAEALRAEAPKMGFVSGAGGWKIGGEIREIYLDNATAGGGLGTVPLLYTSMTVKFEIQSPSGQRLERTLRLPGYFVVVARNWVDAGLARQMVFGAQDALARLNASTLKAPSHAGVAKMLDELRPKPVGDAKDLARMIGLSGSSGAVGLLLDKVRGEADAGDRTYLVEALAAIGSADALDPLAGRYAGEDPDNRLATLKVYEYVDSADSRRRAGQAADKEPDDYLKKLAREVAEGAAMRGPKK